MNDAVRNRIGLIGLDCSSVRGGIGIRAGFKIQCPYGHEGSIPSERTRRLWWNLGRHATLRG